MGILIFLDELNIWFFPGVEIIGMFTVHSGVNIPAPGEQANFGVM